MKRQFGVLSVGVALAVCTPSAQSTLAPLTTRPTVTPLRIALVVDDRGLGLPEVRDGLTGFVAAMRGRAEMGLFSTVRANATVVDFTADPDVLLTGIEELRPMQTRSEPLRESTVPGGMGLPALTTELARQFEQQSTPRSIILVVTIDREVADNFSATSSTPALGVSCAPENPGGVSGRGPDGCYQGGPVFFSGDARGQQSLVTALQRSRATLFAVAARDGRRAHSPMLDVSADVSGGRVESVLTDAGITPAMRRIADQLLR